MIHCILIDDEPLALEVLKRYVRQIPELTIDQTFTDALEAVEYLNTHATDLIFLDIEMPDITGLQLLQALTHKPLIIFTTAHPQYALEGFNVSAIDYLLKPFNADRFMEAAQKAIQHYHFKSHASRPPEYLLVKARYKTLKVHFEEIDYIEGLVDYIRIYTTGKPITTLSTMKAIMQRLPENKFIRIHRSYIVPVERIRTIQYKKIELSNHIVLPVGDTYQQVVQQLKKQ